MGHVYIGQPTPRAEILARLSRSLATERGTKWFDLTERVEKATKNYMQKNNKPQIYPNVDLYSALLYYTLDIPLDLNTPIFAISRVAGWSSHVVEEKFAEGALNQRFIDPRLYTSVNIAGPWDANIHRSKIEQELQLRSH